MPLLIVIATFGVDAVAVLFGDGGVVAVPYTFSCCLCL
jgi:hypothetical protein